MDPMGYIFTLLSTLSRTTIHPKDMLAGISMHEYHHLSTDDFLPLASYELKVPLLGKLQDDFKEQGVTIHLSKD